MKLGKSDLELLSQLYHNDRQSVSNLAKTTSLSRDQVTYRLQKYIDTGLIRSFVPLINTAKLGYSFTVLFFVKSKTISKLPFLSNFLSSNKRCISYGYAHGKYDVYANLVFKSDIELDKFLSTLFNNSEISIRSYKIIKPSEIVLFPLKFLNENKEELELISREPPLPVPLDDLDLQILKLLSANSRMKVVDIAISSNTSSEVIIYRLKKLRSQRVLLGSRVQFDMKKLGYFFSLITINFEHYNSKNFEKIKLFSRKNKFVNSVIVDRITQTCMIQFFYKNEIDFRSSISDLKQHLKDEMVDLDILMIEQEESLVNPVPFL